MDIIAKFNSKYVQKYDAENKLKDNSRIKNWRPVSTPEVLTSLYCCSYTYKETINNF